MKRLFLIAGFSIASMAIYANVNTEMTTNNVLIEVDDKGKVEIKPEELPKNTIAALGDVKIEKAFRLSDAEGNVSGYEVIVNDGQSSHTVLFDKSGNALK